MASTVVRRSNPLPVLGMLISVLAMGLGSTGIASDGFSESLVGGLAVASDLTPLIATDSMVAVPQASNRFSAPSSRGRQSVPAVDRAGFHRDAELFQNSKVALSLLVADLEPRVAPTTRPMSGRLVGVRPSVVQPQPSAAVGPMAGGVRTHSRLPSTRPSDH